MPSELLIITCVLLLGSWFLLGEKSFTEKLTMVFAIAFIYVAFRLLTGATVQDIISPFIK